MLAGIRKELLYFLRSRNALLLIFLVPLLTVAILGNVFNEKSASGISIGICADENSSIGRAYYTSLSKGPFLVKFSSSLACPDEGAKDLASGLLSAVIIVPEGIEERISEGAGEKVRILYDNSKEDVSGIVLAYSSGITREISENISQSFISGAWEGLGKIGIELEIADLELIQARGRLSGLLEKISEAKRKLGNATVGEMQGKVAEMEGFLESQRLSLIAANSTAQGISEKISSANRTLWESMALLEDADLLLEEDINGSKEILRAILPFKEFFSPKNPACLAITCPNISFGEEIVSPLEERVEREEEMRGKISRISDNLTVLGSDLANASAQGKDAQEGIEDALRKLSSAKEALLEMKGALSLFSEERENALTELSEAESLFRNTQGEIEKIFPKLSDAKETIGRISEREPETVISPLGLEKSEVFGSRGFSYVFPAIVALVLMFNIMLISANSILFERKAGTLLRASLSGKGATSLLAPKLAVFGFLGLVQTVIMAVFGALFFSLEIRNLPAFLAIALACSFVFSLFGIVIGFLSNDESSALLSVVGFSIPSLFLSGGLTSFEFLPEGLKAVSTRLPLAVFSGALRTAGVYGAFPTPPEILLFAAILGTAIIFLFGRRVEI